jgi:S-adenosylmethionine synthetase
MNYLFTSESVSECHPDKIVDQISDPILDNYLAFDLHSKVPYEIFVTSRQVIIGGEAHSRAKPDNYKIIRNLINHIDYNKGELGFSSKSCSIISSLHTDMWGAIISSALQKHLLTFQGIKNRENKSV